MTDIFKEVDEGVQQDRVGDLWKRYRLFVYGGIALVIGSVAANELLIKPAMTKARQDRAQGLESAVQLLEDGKYAEAETALKTIADGKSKLAPLGASYLARVRYEGNGDADGAAAALAPIARDEGGPLERLAKLKIAYFKADTQTLAEVEAALGALKDDDSAIGALARELLAAKAWDSGDAARARTEFSRLQFDPKAPEGVRQRAEMALAIIPVTAAPAAPPADPAVPAPKQEQPTP